MSRTRTPVRDRARELLREAVGEGSSLKPSEAVKQAREEVYGSSEGSHSPSSAEPTSTPSWPLKTSPEEYLERYPEGPNAELARKVLNA